MSHRRYRRIEKAIATGARMLGTTKNSGPPIRKLSTVPLPGSTVSSTIAPTVMAGTTLIKANTTHLPRGTRRVKHTAGKETVDTILGDTDGGNCWEQVGEGIPAIAGVRKAALSGYIGATPVLAARVLPDPESAGSDGPAPMPSCPCADVDTAA